MKRLIAAVAVGLSSVAAVAAVAMSALASADPDPHMPDMRLGYCPGGTGTRPLSVVPGAEYNALGYYCDGDPYADGTHWRYYEFPIPFSMIWNSEQVASYGLHCVINDEMANASLAPPGGCNGAV